MPMTRKEFLQAGLAIAGAIALPACGGGASTDDGGGGNCLASGTRATIGVNHTPPHVLTVPKEDIMAGAEKSYAIMGSSDHDHMATITAGHFAMLKSNTSITITCSSTLGHTHSITVSCLA